MSRQPTQKPFSIRMSPRTLARLDLGARRRGEAKARTAERLIDEGLRMEDHPGIVFKDGPTGRRAALAFGPDVWQVVKVVKEFGSIGEQAIAGAAEWGNLLHAQVNVALRYYGDFPEEVDARIAFNREETERQYAAWKRTQQALA
jgi:hypothetical protein